MEDLNRLYCVAHCLNVISSHIFSVKLSEVDLCGSSGKIIVSDVESLVTFLNSSKLNKDLPEAIPLIKDAAPGRFKSKLPMLRLLHNQYTEVYEILERTGEADRIDFIKKEDLFDLIYVVEEVEREAKGDKALHAHNFAWRVEFCKVRSNDSAFLSELRTHLRRELAVLEALEQIELCKTLAAYAKRSGLNSKLEGRLKTPPDTRWNGKGPMLRSVSNYIKKAAEERATEEGETSAPNYNRMEELSAGIDVGVIDSLLEFLQVFEVETDRLQGENYPTLPFALLSYTRLLKHCDPKPQDSLLLSRLREHGQEELKKRLMLNEMHKIATFLWPQFRHLKMLDEEEGNRIWDVARDKCEAIASNEPTETVSEPPLKKARSETADYSDWSETTADTEQCIKDEVTRYLDDRFTAIEATDLLLFWKDGKGCQYPRLRMLAKQTLGIPSTSGPAERVFSLSGVTYDKRRASLVLAWKPSMTPYSTTHF